MQSSLKNQHHCFFGKIQQVNQVQSLLSIRTFFYFYMPCLLYLLIEFETVLSYGFLVCFKFLRLLIVLVIQYQRPKQPVFLQFHQTFLYSFNPSIIEVYFFHFVELVHLVSKSLTFSFKIT